MGATNAIPFSPGKIVVDECVGLKCQVPIRDDYGVNLTFPPNAIPVNEFRKAARKHDANELKNRK